MLKDDFGVKIYIEDHFILVMHQTETPLFLVHPDIFQLLKDVLCGSPWAIGVKQPHALA